MPTPRTIAVVTGTRAEFGLLQTVMQAISDHPRLTLQTIAAGAHFVTDSWRDIPQAGFRIDARVRMQQHGQTGHHADALALGKGITGFAKTFAKLNPDIVVVLGDRIEAFAAASAAAIGGIRVAHLHGGDRAEGVADESMRHAITKLAHLHLPATKASAKRIQRLGEDKHRIHTVGSPSVDGLTDITTDSDAPDAPACIVMHHPIGRPPEAERQSMAAILKATATLDRVVMSPNLDPGREGILQAIQDAGVTPIDHLPRPVFTAMLKGAALIVGNSSAGLIEAAVLKTACVNVGPRQNGREKPRNVIDASASAAAIRSAIRQAQRLDLTRARHPYGDGRTGARVAQLLAAIRLESIRIRKHNTY